MAEKWLSLAAVLTRAERRLLGLTSAWRSGMALEESWGKAKPGEWIRMTKQWGKSWNKIDILGLICRGKGKKWVGLYLCQPRAPGVHIRYRTKDISGEKWKEFKKGTLVKIRWQCLNVFGRVFYCNSSYLARCRNHCVALKPTMQHNGKYNKRI